MSKWQSKIVKEESMFRSGWDIRQRAKHLGKIKTPADFNMAKQQIRVIKTNLPKVGEVYSLFVRSRKKRR